MFLTVILISVALLAIAFIGLGFSIFFRKNGKFPETGVGHNPEMRKLGLTCARSDEIKSFNLQKGINEAKSVPGEYTGCAGCSCSE